MPQPTKDTRRTFLPAQGTQDKTGLSALAWDPAVSGGPRMVGAEQSEVSKQPFVYLARVLSDSQNCRSYLSASSPFMVC